MDIYLLIQGEQQGPYTEEQVKQSLAEGQIQSDIPAWYEGLEDWVPVEGLVGHRAGETPHSSVQEFRAHDHRQPNPPPFSISKLFARGQSVLSQNKKWGAAGIIIVAALIAFFITSSNLSLRGTYRTADNTESVTVLSGSEIDVSGGQGTVTGHYTREGDTLRLVISDQVYHYTIVPEGLKLENGALYLSSRYFEAVQLCNQADEKCSNRDFDGAITVLNQAISICPNYADAYAKRKDAQHLKEQAEATKATELQAEQSATEEEEQIERDRQRIKDMGGPPSFKLSADDQVLDMSVIPDGSKVKDLLQKALQASDKDATSYIQLGLAYYQLKQYDSAVVSFYSAEIIDPHNAKLHNYMGCTYGQQGNTVDALSELSKAIQLQTDFADAYFNRAVESLSGGSVSISTAQLDYKKALELGEKRDPQMDKIFSQ